VEREARPGGDVRVTVAVEVERLAEAKAELTVLNGAREPTRDTPAGTARGASRGSTRRGRKG
jgi:hypothetical protein